MIRVAHAQATFYDDGAMRPSSAILIELDFDAFRTVRRRVGPEAMMVLLEVAALAYIDSDGRLVADTNAGDLAQRVAGAEPGAPAHRGWSRQPVNDMLARLEAAGFVVREQHSTFDGSRSTFGTGRVVLSPRLYLVDDRDGGERSPINTQPKRVVGTRQASSRRANGEQGCAVPNLDNATPAGDSGVDGNLDNAVAELVGKMSVLPGQRVNGFGVNAELDNTHHDDVDEKNHHHDLTEQAIQALERAGVQGDVEELVRTCGASNALAWVDYAISNQRIGNPAAYIASMVRRGQPPPSTRTNPRLKREDSPERSRPLDADWRQMSQRDLDDVMYGLPEDLASEVQNAARGVFGRPVRDAADAAELRSLLAAELAARDLLDPPAGATG